MGIASGSLAAYSSATPRRESTYDAGLRRTGAPSFEQGQRTVPLQLVPRRRPAPFSYSGWGILEWPQVGEFGGRPGITAKTLR